MAKRVGLSAFRTILPYSRGHALALATGFAFMLGQNWGMRSVPTAFRKMVDEIVGANRRDVVFSALLEALLYIALTVVCLYLMRKLIIGVSRKIEYSLRRGLYDRLLELDFDFYQSHETGDLVSRCTNDLENVRTLLGPGIMYIPNTVGMVAFFLPVLIQLSPVLALASLGVTALVVVIIVTVLPRMRPLFQAIQEQTGKMDSRIWQVLSGMTTIKLYANEAVEEGRFVGLNREYLRRTMSVTWIRELLWPSFIFLFAVTELIVILVGGAEVIRGSMTVGELLQFNTMMSTLAFPVLGLGWIMSMLQQGISAMGRINLILEGPVERRSDWRQIPEGELSFETRGLSYRYPTQSRPALENVSLRIQPNELVGITGTIGSGKSTLVNVLTGLLRPERGTVFVNDVDIRDIEPATLFHKVGMVSQLPFLFSRTLAENVAMGANGKAFGGTGARGSGSDGTASDGAATDGKASAGEAELRLRVVEAARMAGLDPDVATFRDGYDQMLGERGITLSGGQKQRTALARALLRDSPVLVLDDSLSGVDAETESRILRNLRTLRNLKTVVVVSHRISPLREADRILVLDQGRLVEEGTHDELVARGGLYARLVRLQQLEEVVGGDGGLA